MFVENNANDSVAPDNENTTLLESSQMDEGIDSPLVHQRLCTATKAEMEDKGLLFCLGLYGCLQGNFSSTEQRPYLESPKAGGRP